MPNYNKFITWTDQGITPHCTVTAAACRLRKERSEVGGFHFCIHTPSLVYRYTAESTEVLFFWRTFLRAPVEFTYRYCSFQIHVLFCTYFTFSATYCAVRWCFHARVVLDLSDPPVIHFPSYPLLGGNTRNSQLLPMKRFIIRSARCYGRTQFGFFICRCWAGQFASFAFPSLRPVTFWHVGVPLLLTNFVTSR